MRLGSEKVVKESATEIATYKNKGAEQTVSLLLAKRLERQNDRFFAFLLQTRPKPQNGIALSSTIATTPVLVSFLRL